MSGGPDYKALYEQSQVRILALEQQLSQLHKMIFGSRHERFIPADPAHPQLSLAITTEPVATAAITSTKQISYTKTNVAVEVGPLMHPGTLLIAPAL